MNSDIIMGFQLMGYGLLGMFIVLVIFYLLTTIVNIRIRRKESKQ